MTPPWAAFVDHGPKHPFKRVDFKIRNLSFYPFSGLLSRWFKCSAASPQNGAYRNLCQNNPGLSSVLKAFYELGMPRALPRVVNRQRIC